MTREQAIEEARRKLDAGGFQRSVVSRTPEDLNLDRITLDCGHQKCWSRSNSQFRHQELVEATLQRCYECAKAWVTENTTK